MPHSPPAAAWKRRMDERLEHPGGPANMLSFGNLVKMLPMILRLQKFMRQQKETGFDPFNISNPPKMGLDQGVPLGGIGGGSIGRGWRGDFRRWMMQPGKFSYTPVFADQFSLFVKRGEQPAQAQVLFPGHPGNNVRGHPGNNVRGLPGNNVRGLPGSNIQGFPQNTSLRSWRWDMNPACATYYGLFPRAWTVYENPLPGVRLTCRQVSPVIPHNYRQSSYPAAVFAWTIENLGEQPAAIGLMFTFQNGTGAPNDWQGGHFNQAFRLPAEKPGSEVCGVALRHLHRQRKMAAQGAQPDAATFEDPLTFAIATRSEDGLEVTYQTRWAAHSRGADIWDDFAQDGRLENLEDQTLTSPGETIGAGVAVTLSLAPGASRELVFSLAWDMPLVRCGFGTEYYRRYTQFYGTQGNAAPVMGRDALLDYPDWEAQIEAWQKPILDNPGLPDWYKMALFNELYYIVDGGTLWAYPKNQPQPNEDQIGHFAYLEGHEYRMVNTYDVHFYSSFALAMLWPKLELSLQRDFARAVLQEDQEIRLMMFDGKKTPRKLRGSVPHDVGWYEEDPWNKLNGYFIHDVNDWKDLNPKFVLQVYRDYLVTQDQQFLADTWEAVQLAMDFVGRHDTDGDGLIENTGFPDQTYDVWTVSGPSAYTGGLWLASLSAAAAIAEALGESSRAEKWRALNEKGKAAYEKLLWNGRYYNYDGSRTRQHDSIMADQLAGHWFAQACGLPPFISPEHAQTALKTVFDYNVMRLHNGEMGAINGMRPDGKVDRTSMQSQEVWTGTSYALAASLLQAGMPEEAFKTAEGVVKTTYYRTGYWFQTPEAWNEKAMYRSLAYMRPLSIWAMQWEMK